MITLRISGWRPGLRKVSMTEALRSSLGIGLAEAKSITDRVLNGEIVELGVASGVDAEALSSALDLLGAESTVVCG